MVKRATESAEWEKVDHFHMVCVCECVYPSMAIVSTVECLLISCFQDEVEWKQKESPHRHFTRLHRVPPMYSRMIRCVYFAA